MSQELKEKVMTLEATLQAFIRHTERSFSKVRRFGVCEASYRSKGICPVFF